MAKIDAKTTGSIDVLVAYKKGGLTLDQAVDRFRKLTGLTVEIAEKFIKGMGRDNIISLEAKRKSYASKQEETNDIRG